MHPHLTATEPDTRPTITRREVSWHTTVAAIRARRRAESQGIDPEAKLALIHSTTVAAAHPPVTLGTLWAIEASEPFIDSVTGGLKIADQALICHTLLHPEESLLSLLAGELDAFAAEVLHTASHLPASRARLIQDHFHAEVARLRHITGGQDHGDTSKKS